MLNPETLRLSTAALVTLSYLLLCWHFLQNRRVATATATVNSNGHNGSEHHWLLAYASQTGNAELLAQQTARALAQQGITVELIPLGQLTATQLCNTQRALFIVSTCGEGDAPDNANRFVTQLMGDAALRLPDLHYGLLALGDASYAQFCGFGRRLDSWLQTLGAQPLFERIDADQLTSASLQQWQHKLTMLTPARVENAASVWHDDSFAQWTLLERHHINHGSQGSPLFHLVLQAPADRITDCNWQAGDLVRIQVPCTDGSGSTFAVPRQYSIASIPASGRLELLVRQQLHDDGSLGLASGWLTTGCAIGAPVSLALQPNASFQIGANATRPLILIGNGSGLSSLRSHLQARHAQQANNDGPPCWLLFGERNVRHDTLFADDINAWQSSGLLSRVDRVFSRDADSTSERYVQQQLINQGTRLRQWLDDGAALYVCGSQKGMGEGVDRALTELVGEATRQALLDSGRYRRDLY